MTEATKHLSWGLPAPINQKHLYENQEVSTRHLLLPT